MQKNNKVMEYHQITAESVTALDTSHLMKLIELFNSFYFRKEGVGWGGWTFLSSRRSSPQTAEVESSHPTVGSALACAVHAQAEGAAAGMLDVSIQIWKVSSVSSSSSIILKGPRDNKNFSPHVSAFFSLCLILSLDKGRIPRYDR